MPLRHPLPTLVPLLLALSACSTMFEYPLIDLSQPEFQSHATQGLDSGKLIIALASGVTAQTGFERLPNYNVIFVLAGAEQHYLQAVAAGLLLETDASGSSGTSSLVLTSLTHNLFIHDTSAGVPVGTDEIAAEWKLLDPDGATVAEYFFLGQHTARTEWGTSAFGESTQARSFEAMRQLYLNTLDGFAQAAELRAFVAE